MLELGVTEASNKVSKESLAARQPCCLVGVLRVAPDRSRLYRGLYMKLSLLWIAQEDAVPET